MTPKSLTDNLKAEARQLGFHLCGVCPAVSPGGITRLSDWLEAGYSGQMHYLPRRRKAYEHPRHVLDGVRSLVMLGMHYGTEPAAAPAAGFGRVSRYAWGPTDYHDLIHHRLKQLAAALLSWSPEARVRGVVDTAPLLEREFAQLAGLGWIGKNTMLLNRHGGSYFFLAALLCDLELQYDVARETDHCGTCTACLEACPTDAFPKPYQLDATRCISYLTIELRDPIPLGLRSGIEDWLFGCDICQEVCPWNRHAPPSSEAAYQPRADANPTELAPLFSLDEQQFRERFRRTPLWRSKRRGLLRNAAIVLGNQGQPTALEPLTKGLNDADPIVRGASAWALGQLSAAVGAPALRSRMPRETDEQVRNEIQAALARSVHEPHSQSSP